MNVQQLPAGDALELFAALAPELERPSLLLGRAEGGFRETLAWQPAAVLEPSGPAQPDAAQRIERFVAEQVARGRLCIGYCSYELGHRLQGLPLGAKPGPDVPEWAWLAYESWLARDGDVWTVRAADRGFLEQLTAAQQRARERALRNEPPIALARVEFRPTLSAEGYAAAFHRIAEYIRAGDIYQVNLTHQLRGQSCLAARDLFPFVARSNPVEHLAYLEGQGFAIHSASPERFVRIRGRTLETFPIKGTRPRGRDPEQDRRQLAELMASEKEAAELNMITDLLRNDLAAVCTPGSVRVSESRVARPGPRVWHTLSQITGELSEGITPLGAVLHMLPGGSISGCPKRRALEIIAELEPAARGPYTGVIGRIDPDGSTEFSVAIRTLIQRGNDLYLSVGGGIVYDSILEQEWEETLLKASSFANLPAQLAASA